MLEGLQVSARVRQALDCLRLCLFRKSRLFAAELLDHVRPASGLRCCCSLFEVDLSAAELLDRVPPGSGGCNALLPKLVGWYGYNRQMSDRHFGASEHQSPCNVSASRTHVDLTLDYRHLHGVVPKHVHQKHLIVSSAGQALHHTPHTRPRTSSDRLLMLSSD